MDDIIADYLEYEMWVEGDKTLPPPTDFFEVKKDVKIIKYSKKVRQTEKATLYSLADDPLFGFWVPTSLVASDAKGKVKVPQWFVVKLLEIKE